MSIDVWIILGGAIVTYLTRAGGHLLLSRFETVHPRVEAALEAVPAAVLATLIAPAVFNSGPAEILALVVACGVALRAGTMAMFVAGAVVLVLARALLG